MGPVCDNSRTMSFSIGKTLGNLVNGAESVGKKAVNEVETTAKNVVSDVKQTASKVALDIGQTWDKFDHGVVDPMLNFGKRSDPHYEPPVYQGDSKSTRYQQLPGTEVVDGTQPSDIDQGRIGDCYFLSSMAAVAETHPELMKNAISQNADGTYTVTFHEAPGTDALRRFGMAGLNVQGYLERFAQHLGMKPTETSQVTIDGKLPDDNGGDPYVHNSDQEQWPELMEKAYAKWWGGFSAIGNGGDPGSALMALTGAPIDRLHLSASKADSNWSWVSQAASAKQPMVAATGGSVPIPGLVTHHAYTVLGVEQDNGQKYVVLRNPWGVHEPGDDGVNDGVFRLTAQDFARSFQTVDVARTA